VSLDIPSKIERDIQQFTQQEHTTHDEAFLRGERSRG